MTHTEIHDQRKVLTNHKHHRSTQNQILGNTENSENETGAHAYDINGTHDQEYNSTKSPQGSRGVGY